MRTTRTAGSFLWDLNMRANLRLHSAVTLLGLSGLLVQCNADLRESTAPLRAVGQSVVCGAASGIPCGEGLLAAFYDNTGFTDLLVVQTTPTVDIDAGLDAPVPELGSNRFSIRWTGYLTAPSTGDYAFSVETTQAMDVFVDGRRVAQDAATAEHPMRVRTGTPIRLEAGAVYPVRIEAEEWGGDALFRWRWTPPGGEEAIVPSSVLQQVGPGQGWRATWYNSEAEWEAGTAPQATTTEPAITGSIDRLRPSGVVPQGYVVRYTADLEPLAPGPYQIRLQCSAPAALVVAGRETTRVSRWFATDGVDETFEVALEAGRRASLALDVRDIDGGPATECTLSWKSPWIGPNWVLIPDAQLVPVSVGRGEGLEGAYANAADGTNWLGTQVDPAIDFDWGTGAPTLRNGEVLAADTWSVTWTGLLEARESGAHDLVVEADDDATLEVATRWVLPAGARSCQDAAGCAWDELCVSGTCRAPAYEVVAQGAADSASVVLQAGQRAPLRLRFVEQTGNARVRLAWAEPGRTDRTTIPSAQLYRPDRSSALGTGLQGHYYNYRFQVAPSERFDWRRSGATVVRLDPTIDFSWGNGAPAPGISSNNFSVRWVGQVRPEHTERYTFKVFSDDGVRLWVNGELLIDVWGYAGWRTGTIELEAGRRYDIQIAMFEGGGSAAQCLFWSSPSQPEQIIPQANLYPPRAAGIGTGLLARYYDGTDIATANLGAVRVEPNVDREYTGAPGVNLDPGPHAVRWAGRLEAIYEEPHTLTVVSNGGVRLWVDGDLAIDAWGDDGDGLERHEVTIPMAPAQLRDIVLEYAQWDAQGSVELRWSSLSQSEQVIPSAQLYPATVDEDAALGQCERVLAFGDFSGPLPDGLLGEGGLQLESTTEVRPDLWIANTTDATVTRIDTGTGEVVATYPAGTQASRTAVDLDFNAWVANRAFGRMGTVNKIISVHTDGTPCECCSERDDAGECIYYDPLDLCGECIAYTIELGHNTVPRGLAIDANNDAWVALYNSRQLVRIKNCDVDPETGVVDYECANPRCQPGDALCIERARLRGRNCSGALPNNQCRGDQVVERHSTQPSLPYGIAMDAEGIIWIAGANQVIGCFDTVTRTSCGWYRDEGIYQRRAGCMRPYGIAVDGEGNVWWGNWTCGGLGYLDRATWRDAVRTATNASGVVNWDAVRIDMGQRGMQQFPHPHSSHGRGVAVDGDGVVWFASSSQRRVMAFDPDLPAPPERVDERSACLTACAAQHAAGSSQRATCEAYCPQVFDGQFIASYPTCSGPIGVGVSQEGDTWVSCGSMIAMAFDDNGDVLFQSPTGRGSYSYSDMTGFQLRMFTAPQARWSQVFDCSEDGEHLTDDGQCLIDFFRWEADIPEGARVVARVRTGYQRAGGVEWEPWSPSFEVAPAPLDRAGQRGEFVEVELTLYASPRGRTPVVSGFEVLQCPQLAPPIELAIEARGVVDADANDYSMQWRFTDDSWPESTFELVSADGRGFCQLETDSSWTKGTVYSGDAPAPGCEETGHLSNTPLTRRARAWHHDGAAWRSSALSEPVTAYTLVNDPLAQNGDLRIPGRGRQSMTVTWCKPRRNWVGGWTGAQVERAAEPGFDPNHPSYRVLASFPSAPNAPLGERGYATVNAFCGTMEDQGLEPGTRYYYRLTYQNGDAIPSAPLVVSEETLGRICCETIGSCEGVCGEAEIVRNEEGDEICQEPPSRQLEETLCDGLDNDCDGEVDEGLLNACGGCGELPPELCDGVDNDCNGEVDEDPIDGQRFYPDRDGDGWGTGVGVNVCSAPPQHVAQSGDCDDGDSGVFPGATEICDGIDQDCDGEIDEGRPTIDYGRDVDGDGYGDPNDVVTSCRAVVGYVDDLSDCVDSDASIHPGAPEICDGVDQDCDGEIDEGFAIPEVEVVAVDSLGDVGATACDNDYDGPVCGGAAAIRVAIRNTGSLTIPASSSLTLQLEGEDAPFVDAEPFGEPVGGRSSVERTWCVEHGLAVDLDADVGLTATLQAASAVACGTFEHTLRPIALHGGPDVCDGRDNDCDGVVDQAPDACGALMICVENTREVGEPFLCVFALTSEEEDCADGSCPEGWACDPTGACVQACATTADCSLGHECHQSRCVDGTWIDAAAEASVAEAPSAAPESPPSDDPAPPPAAGCAAGGGLPPALPATGFLLWWLGMTGWVRNRHAAVVRRR